VDFPHITPPAGFFFRSSRELQPVFPTPLRRRPLIVPQLGSCGKSPRTIIPRSPHLTAAFRLILAFPHSSPPFYDPFRSVETEPSVVRSPLSVCVTSNLRPCPSNRVLSPCPPPLSFPHQWSTFTVLLTGRSFRFSSNSKALSACLSHTSQAFLHISVAFLQSCRSSFDQAHVFFSPSTPFLARCFNYFPFLS